MEDAKKRDAIDAKEAEGFAPESEIELANPGPGFDDHESDEEIAHEGRTWLKWTRVGFAGVLFLLGLFILFQSFSYGWESRGTPGPGFFPFWVGLLIALTAFGWGINEARASIEDQIPQDIDPAGIWRVLRIFLAFVVFLIVFEPLGYNIAVLSFMLYLTYSLGKGKGPVWVMVVNSLGASFGVYMIFDYGLGVRLPGSIIPFLADLGL
jgi:putative tricarboxylic transport membrane protein